MSDLTDSHAGTQGRKERDETYGPILEALEELYKDVSMEDR